MRSLAKRVNEKLCPRFFGPFEIQKQIGEVTYQLALRSGSSIHPIFHFSQLPQALGPSDQLLLPELTPPLEWKMEPQDVLAARIINQVLSVCIRWKGLPIENSSW